MEKVVDTGLKIDLHIHSKASHAKDGRKVANNTLENIPLLISKLSENGVNICAITDHDVFSYEMYHALKAAENQDNSILKVLPGVEFSVTFRHESLEKMLHIVAIFSDADDEKVKRMEHAIQANRPGHAGSYSEEAMLSLLREISLDTILIVHQKRSLSGKDVGGNDANALGEEKFFEFVDTDYFEAFEFRNKRNEVFNRTYVHEQGLEDKVRFVTGTDCHDWTVYPAEDKSDKSPSQFPYTYAKCLPTFKGLVMAMTDHTRLKTGNNSFFCNDKFFLPEITFKQGEQTTTIPLSRGLNVIIGDNSVGKSLMLHALTRFRKQGDGTLPGGVVRGYKKFLKEHAIELKTQLEDDQVFTFDMQGEVRAKFEEQTLPTTEFLRHYFPDVIDPSPYRKMVEDEIDRMIAYLSHKFDLESAIRELKSFPIVEEEIESESLIFIKNLRTAKPRTTKHSGLLTAIDNAIVNTKNILNYRDILSKPDAASIRRIVDEFYRLRAKYNAEMAAISKESDRIETVASVIDRKAESHKHGTSDIQKKKDSFESNSSSLVANIIRLISMEREIRPFSFNLTTTPIEPNHRKLHNYEFICRLRIPEISNEYMESLLARVLKKRAEIDWSSVQKSSLKDKLLNVDSSIPLLQFMKQAMIQQLDEDLKAEYSIIVDGEDRYKQMSSGINAKTYFDLLSYETAQDGLYIIDQPEDNISQSAIQDYLLDRFKTMGENRQVIMVTHNPQFVVNLDVDNLIYISEHDKKLEIQSGALEYSCPQYSILDIVARNIEGGLDSIRKRWKRYEKASAV